MTCRVGIPLLEGGEAVTHPYWHLEAQVDLRERLAVRRQQRAYLARYGRLSLTDDQVTVQELDAYVRAISAIVREENGPTENVT